MKAVKQTKLIENSCQKHLEAQYILLIRSSFVDSATVVNPTFRSNLSLGKTSLAQFRTGIIVFYGNSQQRECHGREEAAGASHWHPWCNGRQTDTAEPKRCTSETIPFQSADLSLLVLWPRKRRGSHWLLLGRGQWQGGRSEERFSRNAETADSSRMPSSA